MDAIIRPKGHVKYVLRRADGSIKDHWEHDNLVVTAGKNFLAAWLAASSQANEFMPYIAIGSGSTAPQLTDTTLGTELARLQGSVSAAGAIYTNTVEFPAGTGTGTVAETGLFSAASSGTMFSRQVFTARPKDPGDSLTITWTLTIS